MLAQQETVTFERTVKASPAEVFRAFTHQAALRDWLCNTASVDARTGGHIYLWWNGGYCSAGRFTDFERPNSLAFTWRGPDDPTATEVRVSISEPEPGRSIVALTQAGIGSGPEWAQSVSDLRNIWEAGLENLQSVLETGVDLRFARRPMFGLTGADLLTPESAAKLGVPVTGGLRLDGVAEGMAAEKAGLERNDVIVSFDGRKISAFNDLLEALQSHTAGDRVEVTYYRGPEKHSTTMELSARTLPDVPQTSQELASVLREKFQALDAELDACFEGVSEEQAEYRPSPDDWSAKEILAHLINVERDNHTWIVAAVEDSDLQNPYHGNIGGRVAAVVAVYGTVSALIDQLKREEVMTISMAESLPEATVACKHLYYQLALGLTTLDTHNKEHLGSLRSLLKEAQK